MSSDSETENIGSPQKSKAKKKSSAFNLNKNASLLQDRYDVQFQEIFNEGEDALKKLLDIDGVTEQHRKIIKWASEIELSSSCYMEVQALFRPILARNDNSYRNFKTLFHSDIKIILDACKRDKDVGLSEKEQKVGIKMLLQEVFNCGMLRAINPNVQNYAPTEEEECSLFYVAGYVVNKLLRKGKSKESQRVGEIMKENDVESIPLEYKKWVEIQSRGGLKYPTVAAFMFFKKIDIHVAKYLNDSTCTDRIEKVMRDIKSDLEITEKWNAILSNANVDTTAGDVIFKMVINTFINTKGNGLTKKIRNQKKEVARKNRLKTKFESKEKLKKKIEMEVRQQILGTHIVV